MGLFISHSLWGVKLCHFIQNQTKSVIHCRWRPGRSRHFTLKEEPVLAGFNFEIFTVSFHPTRQSSLERLILLVSITLRQAAEILSVKCWQEVLSSTCISSKRTNWKDWCGENSLFTAESQTVFGCWFPVYEIRWIKEVTKPTAKW